MIVKVNEQYRAQVKAVAGVLQQLAQTVKKDGATAETLQKATATVNALSEAWGMKGIEDVVGHVVAYSSIPGYRLPQYCIYEPKGTTWVESLILRYVWRPLADGGYTDAIGGAYYGQRREAQTTEQPEQLKATPTATPEQAPEATTHSAPKAKRSTKGKTATAAAQQA